jgi:hypothetical protein
LYGWAFEELLKNVTSKEKVKKVKISFFILNDLILKKMTIC